MRNAKDGGVWPREASLFISDLDDLSLLERADHAVAVANARSEVRAAADEVIASNEDDAVASYLRDCRSGNGR